MAGRPKRSLSQSFLVDPNLRRKVVGALEAGPGDRVLEIGPGHGELSELLVGRVGRLVLVEKDDALAVELQARWGGRPDVRVVHGDALDLDLSLLVREEAAGTAGTAGVAPLRVISNVPYGITSPLIFRLLELRPRPARLVLTVQKEVAERIVAPPGTRAYGALSVGVRTRAEARIAFTLGRRAFRPVPEVDSAAVVLEPIRAPPDPDEEEALRALTREAFGRRRKQLRTILRTSPWAGLEADEAERVLREVGVEPEARPETLAPERFLELARRLRRGGPGRPAARRPPAAARRPPPAPGRPRTGD